MPLGKIIVITLRILAEQPLDQILPVIEHEDDRLQAEAVKYRNILNITVFVLISDQILPGNRIIDRNFIQN
jgi:hypothetical protein